MIFNFNEEIYQLTEEDIVSSTNANRPHNQIHENVVKLYESIHGTTTWTLEGLFQLFFGNLSDYSGNGAKILNNGGLLNSIEKVGAWIGLDSSENIDATKIEYSPSNNAMSIHPDGISARDFYIPRPIRGQRFILAFNATTIDTSTNNVTLNINGETVLTTVVDNTVFTIYTAKTIEEILSVKITNNVSDDILIDKLFIGLFTSEDVLASNFSVESIFSFDEDGSPILGAGHINGLKTREGDGTLSIAYIPISDGNINVGLNADLVDGKHASDLADVNHLHTGVYSTTGHLHDDRYVQLDTFNPDDFVKRSEFDPSDYVSKAEFDPNSFDLSIYATKNELNDVINDLDTLQTQVDDLDVPILNVSEGGTYVDSSGDVVGQTLSLTINGTTYNLPFGSAGGTCHSNCHANCDFSAGPGE